MQRKYTIFDGIHFIEFRNDEEGEIFVSSNFAESCRAEINYWPDFEIACNYFENSLKI